MSDDLKPCPFCTDAESPRAMWVDWGYRVVCLPPPPPEFSDMPNEEDWPQTGCGSMGARYDEEADAIAAWNRRAEAAAALAEAQAEVARLREERDYLAFDGRTLQGWSQHDVIVNSEGAYRAIKIIADRLAALQALPIADEERVAQGEVG